MIKTVVEHGRPLAGTKLRVVSEVDNLSVGDIVYVKEHQAHVRSDEVLVTANPNYRLNYADGTYLESYELVIDNPLASLTDEERQKVTDNALEAATKRGYCDETKKILSDLGLPTERTVETKTVTVEITYTEKPGYVFLPANLLYNDLWTKNGDPVIEITSAKKV